ncbi:hypothetical protein [Streptomyces sp. MK5]|uniref:hypothetical protein n=1 Tax=Streptomyces sp. MK5 TaxID=3064253 RepID=UPI002740E744|nr:hypothetical protein [Streptomyces sp. MK5]
MNDLTYTERARFLAAVQDMGEGDEIPEAAYQLIREIEADTAAPWAQSDPLAAERYLAARGATAENAAANAAEFELSFRALYALATGKPAQSFQDIVDWIAKNVDGAQ